MSSVRIRAVTVGVDLDQYNPNDLVQRLSTLYTFIEQEFLSLRFPVQTRRLTLPAMQVSNSIECYRIKSTIDTLNRISEEVDIRWICLPLTGQHTLSNEVIQIITSMTRLYTKLFTHFMVAEDGVISNLFLASAARVVLAVSRLSNNGYDNFRIGIGANILPNTPYFPFSYHQGETGFSLAVELIELLILTVKQSGQASLVMIRKQLIEAIVPIIKKIDTIGKNIEQCTGFQYKGQDISIAPFPDEVRSVATLIEMVGHMHCGHSGTLMATSLLTDVLKTAIKKSGVRAVGFNGVMFSPLEDIKLAEANNQRHLSVEKLMLYSAVCGCGIDMVPVPGDILADELTFLSMDVAALSTILRKPLGIRVLPIPMKAANELTNFNHDFLTNTRIMGVDTQHRKSPSGFDQAFGYLRFEEKNIKETTT